MDAPGGHVEYVRSSTVRAAVLDAVRDTPRGTTRLVADLDASESAVYEAVNALADRGLLVEGGEGWRATGTGVLVSGCLDRERRLHRAIAADEAYWERHDPTAIPERYRCFEVFADAEVLRASDADPHRVTRAIADRIDGADRMRVLASIYHPEFADALTACPDARLVLDRTVVSEVGDDSGDGDPGLPVRIGEVPFSLTVTEDSALLSLPLFDGGYDGQSELVSESEAAVEWGHALFESYWDDATPVDG